MGFAPPPSPDLQPFSTQGPAYSDPLQTLAEMQHLRTQGMQQQVAGLGLQQARLKMDSQKALLDAFVQGKGDLDATYQHAVQSGKVLPEDLTTFQTHKIKTEADMAALDEKKRTMLGEDINNYLGAISGVKDQAGLDAANAAAQKRGLFASGKFTPLTQYPEDPAHLEAYGNGLLGLKQLLERKKEQAGISKEEAQTKLAGAQTTEAEQKVNLANEEAARRAIQASPVDQATGTPTPAAAIAVQRQYPDVKLPQGNAPKEEWDRFIRAGVPTEKQPEYDIKAMQAKLGLLGNDKWDQFLLQHARSLGKTPAQLTPAEFKSGLGQFAELTQSPQLLALAIGQKGLQEQLTRAQIAAMPTPEGIDLFARMLVNHEMSPDQLNELRSGRTAAAPQIIMKARQIDPNFNMARMEAEYKAMTAAEKDFGTGTKGDIVRANNNSIEHMGLLDEARQALGTNNIPLLRSIAQRVGVAFGADAPTTYDLIAKKVGDEFTKSFVPGAGGEKERLEAAADFRRELGDKQIKSNIGAAIHLMDSQQRNLINQYNRSTYGKGTLGSTLFTPEAMTVRDRLLGTAPAAPKGPAGTVPLKVKREDGSIGTAWLTPAQAKKFTEEHPDIVVK